MNIYICIIGMIAGLILSIILHEIGHYEILRRYYQKAEKPQFKKLPFKVTWVDGAITKEQEKEVYFGGIILGFYPIILMLWITYFYPIIWFIGLIIYFYGCKYDIKKMIT